MAQTMPGTIDAQIGNVTTGGQVAVGSNILQINNVEGDLVFRTGQKPAPPQLRKQPVKVLPKRFAGMLDRQVETETVVKRLQANESLEFNGEPGAGKTSLLRHLAHLPQVEGFQSGVIYFQVNGISPSDLAHSLFEAFYEYDSATKPTEMELRHTLQQIKGLVLLDDVEMTQDQIEQLMNLAPNCVFVTASTKRTLAGETEAILLKGLPTAEAVTLFQRELGRALSDQELIAVSRLCDSLKCHPRSILRSATQAREGGRPLIEAVAQQVNASPSDAAPAQIKQASENEKRVLTALAVFYGAPVQVEHVAAVAGLINIDKEIENLERKGLVESHDERYCLPSDVNVALLDNLSGSFARALIHFTDWAERHRPDTKNIAKAALPILLVLKWGLAAKCWPEVLRLAHATEEALTYSGHWDMWATTLENALQAARAQSNRAEEAWALHQLGTRALCLEENATAKANLREALKIREQLGDTAGAAVTRQNLNLLLVPAGTESKGDDNGGGGGHAGPGGVTVPLMLKIGLPILLTLLGGAAAWEFIARPTVVSASIVTFSTEATSIDRNGQTQLCYEVQNASKLTISPDIGERESKKDCIPVEPQQTTTYTLTATGADNQTASRELTIIVNQPNVLAEVSRFEVVPIVTPGNPNDIQFQLCYGVRSAVKIVIDNGIGDVTLPPQRCLPIKPAQTTTYTLIATDVQGQTTTRQATANVTEPPPLPPQILSFDPSDRSIDRGKIVRLCYELADVSSARIEPAVGEVKVGPGRQCVPAAPKDNTEYVLTAVNAAGKSVHKKAAVTVIQPPARIASFKAEPDTIVEEGIVKLCYSVQNAKSLRLDRRTITPLDTGCVTDSIHETTTYTLSAAGLDGSVTNNTITVPVERRPIEIVQFRANPQTIDAGSKSEICYEVNQASSISIDPRPRSLPLRTSDCTTVAPKETTTYTLTASAPQRATVTRQLTITVKQPEPKHARVVSFTVSSHKIKPGETVELCYTVVDAQFVSLSPVSRSLSNVEEYCLDHAPKSTTTYTLTAIGEDRQKEDRSETVEVEAERVVVAVGPTESSRPTEPVVPAVKITRFEIKRRRTGGLQVCYGLENARSARIEPDFYDVTLPGKCLDIRAREPRTYTITATGPDGRTEQASVDYTPLPQSPPPTLGIAIAKFWAKTPTIKPGAQVELCYIIIGEGTAQISSYGSVAPSPYSCVTVAPRQTTTYTLTVTSNQGQQSSKSTTVTVKQQDGPILMLRRRDDQ